MVLALVVLEPSPVDWAHWAVSRRSLPAGLALDHAEASTRCRAERFGVVVRVIHGARVGRGSGAAITVLPGVGVVDWKYAANRKRTHGLDRRGVGQADGEDQVKGEP